ncbi:MAG: hypothetical protein J1F03_02335 [Oscillospiraceae bacterium]|nr:hypothetical protein [Oscillospiraceae bacterium]
MRKLTLFLAAVLMISLAGCADNRPSESIGSISNSAENEPAESDSNSSSADYSHIAESEQQFGLINAPSGQYTYGPIDPKDELAVHGIFRKTDNGGYDLVIKLSMKESPAFSEDDFLYCLEYSVLTKYDLSADDVEGSAERITLLPPMSNISYIRYHDNDYLYVDATLWDEENGRSTLGEYYKIARDGSSYEEIAFEDIPKYE